MKRDFDYTAILKHADKFGVQPHITRMRDIKSGSGKSRDDPRRQRRRARLRPVIDHTIPSPCLAVCRFDGEPFCVGCFRNVDEIRDWMIMTREQKLAVLEQLKARKQSAKK